MHRNRVTQLGCLGMEVSDMAARAPFAGWQTPDVAAMQAVGARLQSQGLRVSEGTRAQANERRVAGLIKAKDPNGVINEVYRGPQTEAGQPVRSPRANEATRRFGGFVAGAQAAGWRR